MRPYDGIVSTRQKRLNNAKPLVESVRQKSVIEMSYRDVRGFEKNAQRIAQRQAVPYDRAAAILAASTRRASAAARRKNPRLKLVKGKADKK